MIRVSVRKQGGAAVITIPSDILKLLNIEIGDTLSLDVANKGLIAKPIKASNRKRYTLVELLQGASEKDMKALEEETKWFRKTASVGREKT